MGSDPALSFRQMRCLPSAFVRLNRGIAVASTKSLVTLWDRCSEQFDAGNVVAAINRIAKLEVRDI